MTNRLPPISGDPIRSTRERRKHVRASLDAPIWLRVLEVAAEPIEGRIMNISKKGMKLRLPKALGAGSSRPGSDGRKDPDGRGSLQRGEGQRLPRRGGDSGRLFRFRARKNLKPPIDADSRGSEKLMVPSAFV